MAPNPSDIYDLLQDRLMISSYSYTREIGYPGHFANPWHMPSFGCTMGLVAMHKDPTAVEAVLRDVIADLQMKGAYVQINNFEWKWDQGTVTVTLDVKIPDEAALTAVREYTNARF
jgi:hypothetical protein